MMRTQASLEAVHGTLAMVDRLACWKAMRRRGHSRASPVIFSVSRAQPQYQPQPEPYSYKRSNTVCAAGIASEQQWRQPSAPPVFERTSRHAVGCAVHDAGHAEAPIFAPEAVSGRGVAHAQARAPTESRGAD